MAFSHSLCHEGTFALSGVHVNIGVGDRPCHLETFAVEKIHQIYEQKQSAPERAAALDDYIDLWVPCLVVPVVAPAPYREDGPGPGR